VGIDRVLRKSREAPLLPAAARVASNSPAHSETIELSPSGLELVASEEAATSDDAAADPDIERWHVYDLSSKGYGLLIDRAAAELVLLNGVLALRNHETGGWIIGTVVRKLANRARGEILVGVEVLSYRPIAVELVPESGGAPVHALYMAGIDPNAKSDSIMVRIGDFRSDQHYTVTVAGAQYRIRLNRILRKGSDWIKARFEIESKS
jgi:hypothetical protein